MTCVATTNELIDRIVSEDIKRARMARNRRPPSEIAEKTELIEKLRKELILVERTPGPRPETDFRRA